MKALAYSIRLELLMILLLIPAVAQHDLEYVDAYVPFRFSVGQQSLPEGHYRFVFVGVGLVALHDSRGHLRVTLITRTVETPEAPLANKLIFEKKRKEIRLAGISLANVAQVMQVLGEETPRRSSPPETACISRRLLFSTAPAALPTKECRGQ